MKKRGKVILAVSTILLLGAVGITYAATIASASTKHQVRTGKVEIQLCEDTLEEKILPVAQTMGMEKQNQQELMIRKAVQPGDIIEDSIWVQNTGTQDCYVRVLINRSWFMDEEKIFDASISPKTIQVLSEAGWLIRGAEETGDDEVLECYYVKPLAPGESTANVMEELSILKQEINENSNAYANLSAQLLFSADAIQAYAPQAAMLAEWGVSATFQDDGTITSVTNQ